MNIKKLNDVVENQVVVYDTNQTVDEKVNCVENINLVVVIADLNTEDEDEIAVIDVKMVKIV